MSTRRVFRRIDVRTVECPKCKRRFEHTVGEEPECPRCGATSHGRSEYAPNPLSEHNLETVSGRKIDPFDLYPEDVDVQDVAFALSNICRWHGHVDRSVLEHSLDVMEIVRLRGQPVATQFTALTHDAQEYVLNDLARGVKRQPSMQAYRNAEARAVEVLRGLWGIATDERREEFVKRADNVVMFLEADRWIPSRGRTFSNWTEKMQADVEEHRENFSTPRVAGKMDLRCMFLSAFANLRRGRNGGGAIVGVTGYKGSGKDTFGGVLCREGGFARVAFADPIKQECSEFAGVDVADMERDKEAWRPLWRSRGEFARRMNATHWIDKLRESFDSSLGEDEDPVYASSFVVTDMRFPSEADFVREYAAEHGMEALVVRLRRADQPAVTEDPHESERGVDDIDADRDVTCASAEGVECAARDYLNGKWDEREK